MLPLTLSFQENLKLLPTIDRVQRIDIFDTQGVLTGRIFNQPGQKGSLAVYQYLKMAFGAIDAQAAAYGLLVFAEHRAEAEARPGSHPNIDRLLAIVEGTESLAIDIISEDSR